MEYPNQADEYRRLEALYAEMSDEQIEAMAGKMEDFTELAQQVLRAEMSKRGLGPKGLDPPEDPVEAARRALQAEMSEQDGATQAQDVATQADPYLRDPFPSWLEPGGYDKVEVWCVEGASKAREIMSVLESAGFKPYLGRDNAESVDDYHGSYEGGVDIKVMKFQARYAIEELRRYAARAPEPEPSEEEDLSACCPNCNSKEIVFQSIEVDPGKDRVKDGKFNWTCDACGHRWTDDGIEKLA